jgi:hypothetical protein
MLQLSGMLEPPFEAASLVAGLTAAITQANFPRPIPA